MCSSKNFNTCALLTGVGRSAVAVIGCQGPSAIETIQRCFDPASQRPFVPQVIRFGNWIGPTAEGTPADDNRPGEAVVVLLKHQSNDGSKIEIHCHGGSAAIKRILDDLCQCGVQYQSSQPTSLCAEAEIILSRCQTARTAAIALDQVRGKLSDWADGWLDRLDRLDRTSVTSPSGAPPSGDDVLQELHAATKEILSYAAVTTRLDQPFRIVLAGLPNVGKSSLINAILGYDRSITTPIAGTTRDILHADTVIDGIAVRLSDTAGIHASAEAIEREGIERARQEILKADLVLAIAAPDNPAIDFGELGVPRIDVLNKSDLVDSLPTDDTVCTTATTGQGIDELLDKIAGALGRSFPPRGAPAPINARQTACLSAISKANRTDSAIQAIKALLLSDA
ncbi:tRNA modification GTPase MnmE [Novipirellula aureliae]|uniref:tRNA modification GTPase MnmE n=1 Tax=Novipirellula aureliae TaxID=2527966 RepID=A0A5C6DXM5_9BACT|nr:GTPase [Novipirellula aureliae]TWU41418.1 tRNA modification GTPase MnmE [Novipirellula aureliae]